MHILTKLPNTMALNVDHFSGVTVGWLASSAVGCDLDPQFNIGFCCFSAQYKISRSKSNNETD